MGNYVGDYAVGSTFYHRFTTVNASGVPTTLGNTPSCEYYVDGGTTAFSGGLSLTVDFNSKTGLNSLQVIATTSCTGIASAKNISVQIAAGTVSAVSVVGYPVIEYSLENRSPLRPATAGRTLLVSSTGYAGIDWNSIGTPGATQSLSATTIFTTTNVTNNVGAVVTAVNTITPARVTAQGIDVGAIVTAINTIAPARVTAQGIDVGAIVTAINTIAPARVTAQGIDVGAIVTAFNTIAPANVTAFSTNIGAVVTASSINIGAIVTACNTVVPANVTAASINIGAVVTASNINIGAVVTAVATTTAVQSGLAHAIWDAAMSGYLNAGSTGEALNAAGGAGDPWITSIPGAYTTGQAGHVLGSIVQAAVTAIQAKTTGLSFTVSGQVDANIQYVNDTQVTGTGASGNEWGPV